MVKTSCKSCLANTSLLCVANPHYVIVTLYISREDRRFESYSLQLFFALFLISEVDQVWSKEEAMRKRLEEGCIHSHNRRITRTLGEKVIPTVHTHLASLPAHIARTILSHAESIMIPSTTPLHKTHIQRLSFPFFQPKKPPALHLFLVLKPQHTSYTAYDASSRKLQSTRWGKAMNHVTEVYSFNWRWIQRGFL